MTCENSQTADRRTSHSAERGTYLPLRYGDGNSPKGASTHDVCKIFGFFDPLTLVVIWI